MDTWTSCDHCKPHSFYPTTVNEWAQLSCCYIDHLLWSSWRKLMKVRTMHDQVACCRQWRELCGGSHSLIAYAVALFGNLGIHYWEGHECKPALVSTRICWQADDVSLPFKPCLETQPFLDQITLIKQVQISALPQIYFLLFLTLFFHSFFLPFFFFSRSCNLGTVCDLAVSCCVFPSLAQDALTTVEASLSVWCTCLAMVWFSVMALS